GILGQSDKLRRSKGNSGNTHFPQIELVNYQPRGAGASIGLSGNHKIRLECGYALCKLPALFRILTDYFYFRGVLPGLDDPDVLYVFTEERRDLVHEIVSVLFSIPLEHDGLSFEIGRMRIDLHRFNVDYTLGVDQFHLFDYLLRKCNGRQSQSRVAESKIFPKPPHILLFMVTSLLCCAITF